MASARAGYGLAPLRISRLTCRISLTSRSSVRSLCQSPRQCSIQRSDAPDLELPKGNFVNVAFKHASRQGQLVAMECSVTGRRYSYSQVLDRMARWAGLLTRLGIGKGDVVGVLLPNCPEYPIVFYGAIAIGAIVSTINPAYSPEEIAQQLENCQAKVVVGDPLLQTSLSFVFRQYRRPFHLVTNGASPDLQAIDLRQVIEDPTIPFADPIAMTGEEVALLPYSSGTTGPPKGVNITHNALSALIPIFTHPHFNDVNTTDESKRECFACILPYYHIYGFLSYLMCGFHQGVRLLTIPKFDPNTFVSTISKHKVQTLHLVPTLLNFLVHSPEVTHESFASVRRILSGGASSLPSTVVSLMEKAGDFHFQEIWGMTEVILGTAVPCSSDKLGTIGKLLPNVTAKVVDLETEETLSANQDGEFCIKSPMMMAGYCNNPKATAHIIDQEGWLHTGDVASFDSEGFFRILGRNKDLIKVKGFQVSPSELENVIQQHPGVQEVGVMGVEDERLGEVPRAYVVPKGALKEEDIHRFLEPRVAPFKRLVGGVYFVDHLPKNHMGKLLRSELKKQSLT